MMNKIWNIIASEPVVSIITFGVLLALFMWLFKDEIKAYLIKRWDLYTAHQMKEFALRYAYMLDELEKKGERKKDVQTAFMEYNAQNRLGHKD